MELSPTEDREILRRVRANPKVQTVWNEGADGWWLELNKGWDGASSPTVTLNQPTLTELEAALKARLAALAVSAQTGHSVGCECMVCGTTSVAVK